MMGATLAVLALGLLVLIGLPLLIAGMAIALFLKIVFAVLLFPFKVIGWGVSGFFDGLLFLLKAFGVLLLGGVLVLLALTLLALPLITLAPILLVAGLIWLAWRMARPSRTPAGS